MKQPTCHFKKRGIYFSDKQVVQQCFGRPIEAFSELAIDDADAALAEMYEFAQKKLAKVELYPDALFVLEALKKSGKQTALITTSKKKGVTALLDHYAMHHFFDVVVAQEDTTRHKPHSEPLEKALALLGGSIENAVMIGDSDKDIGAGTNTGVDSILFYPESHEKFYDLDILKELKPTYIVKDFTEILDIV